MAPTVIRLKSVLFVGALLLLAALLAWLSVNHSVQVDTTAQARHSLSAASVRVVQSLDGALRIDAWLEPNAQAKRQIVRMIDRYQQHKADIALHFINPVTSPAQAREKGIYAGGGVDSTLAGARAAVAVNQRKNHYLCADAFVA